MNNLMKKQKKQLIGRASVKTASVLKNVFLWRASNESAVIKEAINNPDMSMKQIHEKIDHGLYQTFLMVPISPKAETHVLVDLSMGFAANYGLTFGVIAGLSLLPGMQAPIGVLALLSLPAALSCMMAKIILFNHGSNPNSGYMKKLQKKIEAERRKKRAQMNSRMRQVIG